jgi:outer membrane protein insertion porin family
MELRHPVITGQSATIFLLAFVEGGNVWDNLNQFNPFNVRRSVVLAQGYFYRYLVCLGLDYGYGFDAKYRASLMRIKGISILQFHKA